MKGVAIALHEGPPSLPDAKAWAGTASLAGDQALPRLLYSILRRRAGWESGWEPSQQPDPRHSRRSRTWRRRKAEEFPEDTRNLKAAEELERLAAEDRNAEHSEIHQQICDMQERIDRMMTAIFGFGLWSVRPNSRHFARSGFTSATTPDCNFSNGTATCWRKSFRIVSRTLFPPSRYGPSSDKQPNIRTSEHHVSSRPALECSDVRLVGQEARKRVLELRCPVTVPRAIGSLSRMNDDGANIIVSQQRRDLVFGDWAAAAIFVPRRVWIGDKLLHHLLRCYFRAVLGEHRPQSRQQLYSDAWLIWSAREVNRRPTCLLGPTTTSMLRNLQQQFPIGVQPIVKTWRLRRLQVLELYGRCRQPTVPSLRRIVENSGSSAYAKSSAFSSGFLGHILRIILRLAIVRGNLVLPRMTFHDLSMQSNFACPQTPRNGRE